MATKSPTPAAGGVNAAHADIPNTESFRDNHPDHDLIEAWQKRREAFAIYNTLPFNEDIDGEPHEYSPEERDQIDIIDKAEVRIQAATAATNDGVIIQLLAALAHMEANSREVERAISNSDLPALFAMDKELDWDQRMVLAAIRSLQAMSPASDFDVPGWLARFETVGGYITPNSVGWYIENRDDHGAAARIIFSEIENSPERREAVRAYAKQPEQVARYRRSLEQEA